MDLRKKVVVITGAARGIGRAMALAFAGRGADIAALDRDGDGLAVVEGMKMQHAIRAGRAGRVAIVLARLGELVEAETALFEIEPG